MIHMKLARLVLKLAAIPLLAGMCFVILGVLYRAFEWVVAGCLLMSLAALFFVQRKRGILKDTQQQFPHNDA